MFALLLTHQHYCSGLTIMKKRLLSALVLPMMLAACSTTGITTKTPQPVTGNELANGNWSLVQIDNQDIAQPEAAQAPTLTLAADLAANQQQQQNNRLSIKIRAVYTLSITKKAV
jgi:hypothetical protein